MTSWMYAYNAETTRMLQHRLSFGDLISVVGTGFYAPESLSGLLISIKCMDESRSYNRIRLRVLASEGYTSALYKSLTLTIIRRVVDAEG